MRLPLFFKELIGFNILPLGALYYVYMILMLVFCSQSINIHAGINGLEPGQSFIIGLVCLVWNIIEFSIDSHKEKRDDCLLSIFIIIPLLATSLALLTFNWFPAQVFVGDTYTLFAGMTLGVASILGHFSKLTLMFFLPQLLNFLLSLPQLMGLFGMTCPRHRLCRLNLDERVLEGRPEVLHGVRAEVPVREQAGLPDDDEGVLRELSDQAVSVHKNSRVKANPSEGLSY